VIGGEGTTISFSMEGLETDGDYKLFCSFPGHFMIMQGELHIPDRGPGLTKTQGRPWREPVAGLGMSRFRPRDLSPRLIRHPIVARWPGESGKDDSPGKTCFWAKPDAPTLNDQWLPVGATRSPTRDEPRPTHSVTCG